MTDLRVLVQRAQASGDGEAFVAVARGRGYRFGVGARAAAGREATFFAEVVLDLLPDRPQVDPADLGARAELAQRLRRRGYSFLSDDTGVITGERAMTEKLLDEEIAAILGRLETLHGHALGPRLRPAEPS